MIDTETFPKICLGCGTAIPRKRVRWKKDSVGNVVSKCPICHSSEIVRLERFLRLEAVDKIIDSMEMRY